MMLSRKVHTSLYFVSRLTMLLIGLAIIAVAGPSAEAATTCHAEKASVSGARGFCNDPASHLSFKVIATCRHSVTQQTYQVESPLVPTSQIAFVNCTQSAGVDPILTWGTQIVQTGPPPPTVTYLFCEHLGNQLLRCILSASNWTNIRWFVNGSSVSAWNNQTQVIGSCSGFTQVDARVSNAHGTTVRSSFVNCSGPAP